MGDGVGTRGGEGVVEAGPKQTALVSKHGSLTAVSRLVQVGLFCGCGGATGEIGGQCGQPPGLALCASISVHPGLFFGWTGAPGLMSCRVSGSYHPSYRGRSGCCSDSRESLHRQVWGSYSSKLHRSVEWHPGDSKRDSRFQTAARTVSELNQKRKQAAPLLASPQPAVASRIGADVPSPAAGRKCCHLGSADGTRRILPRAVRCAALWVPGNHIGLDAETTADPPESPSSVRETRESHQRLRCQPVNECLGRGPKSSVGPGAAWHALPEASAPDLATNEAWRPLRDRVPPRSRPAVSTPSGIHRQTRPDNGRSAGTRPGTSRAATRRTGALAGTQLSPPWLPSLSSNTRCVS